MSYVYELPFGVGRRFNSENSVIRGIFGAWEVGGITVKRSGLPFTPVISGDWSGTGQFKDRPNLIGDPNLRDSERSVRRWFRTEAFQLPPRGEFGNSGRNVLTGPGSTNFDFSLKKRLVLNEQKAVELRFEFFNAFNTPTFILPNAIVNSSNFGRIFQANEARQIQLGMKYAF